MPTWMIRAASTFALGLMLNTCPLAAPEQPDGYARITGEVVMQDRSAYSGDVHVLCGDLSGMGPSFFSVDRADRQGRFDLVLRAPFASRPMDGSEFQFLCRVQAGRPGAILAARYMTVRFARLQRDAATTRIDLREGEIEPLPLP